MGIRGDEGDGYRVVGGSVIPAISTIPPHLPIPFCCIYIKMKSCQENKILADSSARLQRFATEKGAVAL
jgi:hypothetical protein